MTVREVALRYRRRRLLKPILGSHDVARLMRELTDDTREHFLVLYLDGGHSPIGWQIVAIGTANSTLIHPREIYQPAVHLGACAVMIAHNHPSGIAKPSAEDREVTRRLFDAGHVLGIQLLDHVVVGEAGKFWSFQDEGEMPRTRVAQPEVVR